MLQSITTYNSLYWKRLYQITPTVMLIVFGQISHLFADAYNQLNIKRGTRYQGGVSVSCLDCNECRWSTKIDLYSLGRHFKNENKHIHVYIIVQS